MKFTCSTNILNKAVQTVTRAIKVKAATPILSGLHVIAKDDKLRFEGTDLGLTIGCDIDATVEEAGEAVINAKFFAELVRKLPGNQVEATMEPDGKKLAVESGNSKFSLLVMDVKDYPAFPALTEAKNISIKESEISQLIEKTIYATSTDETKPLFTGVLFDFKTNELTAVGTNAHRMALKTVPIENTEPFQVIVSSKTLAEVGRNIKDDSDKSIEIEISKRLILFRLEDTTIVSVLIDGKFPDYNRIMPPNFTTTLTVDKKELAGAVDRAALFSDNADYSIVKFLIEQNSLTVMSQSQASGAGKETLSCQTDTDGLKIAFNAKYLMDLLKYSDGQNVTIKGNSSLSPVVITCDGYQDKDTVCVVTPVRVVS